MLEDSQEASCRVSVEYTVSSEVHIHMKIHTSDDKWNLEGCSCVHPYKNMMHSFVSPDTHLACQIRSVLCEIESYHTGAIVFTLHWYQIQIQIQV